MLHCNKEINEKKKDIVSTVSSIRKRTKIITSRRGENYRRAIDGRLSVGQCFDQLNPQSELIPAFRLIKGSWKKINTEMHHDPRKFPDFDTIKMYDTMI